MTEFGLNQVEMMLVDTGVTDYSKAVDTRRIYAGMQETRATDVRLEAYWPNLQPSRDQYNWVDLDRIVILANEYGLRPLLIMGPHRPGASSFFGLFANPGWATATDFGNMCRAVANRYGPNGMNLVSEFEIWNEQNHYMFWGAGGPDPAGFTAYLKAASDNIRAVHPTATIVSGGLMPIGTLNGFTMDPLAFVKGMYAAGSKGYFDVLGNHPYAIDMGFHDEIPSSAATFTKMDQDIHDFMVTQGDGAVPHWWTEIGFASPIRMSEVQKQAWLALQVGLFKTTAHAERFYIYNYRDSGADTSNENNTYGIVTYAGVKKQPTWNYVASLNSSVPVDGVLFGVGNLSCAVSPTAKFVGAGTLTASVAVKLAASFTGAGVLNVPVFGRPDADLSGVGALSALSAQVVFRSAGFTGSGTLSLVRTGFQRSAAFNGEGALQASTAQQRFFDYLFTGSTKPTGLFTEFGLGYTVSGGVANCGHTTTEGYYYSGGIYNTTHLSADHSAEVTTAPGYGWSLSGERSIMPIVRSNSAGTSWVGCSMHWNWPGSCQIVTCISGVVTLQASGSGFVAGDADRIKLVAEGNTYTVYKNGEPTGTSWSDINGVFPGAANTRTGFGFQHVRSGGVNWDTGGLSEWSAADLAPTQIVAPRFVGTGVFTAAIQSVAAAIFTGTGSLTASADDASGPPGRAAGFTGAGALTASVSVVYTMSAGFSGAGTLAAQVVLASVNATLAGSGALSATVKTQAGFYSAGAGGQTSGTTALSTRTASWSHTIATSGPTTRGVVAVAVSVTSATAPAVSATYGGVSMTLDDDAAVISGSAGRVYLFSLQNPPNGAQTVSVTANLVGSITRVWGNSIAYTKTNSVSTVSSSGSSATGAEIDIPTATGDMALAIFATNTTSITVFNGTPRYKVNGGANPPGFADSILIEDIVAAAGTTTLAGHGNTNSVWVALGAAIQGANV